MEDFTPFYPRAERRRQLARIKKNRKNYWGGIDTPARLGKAAQYPAACSCCGCGNSRRHFGERTVDELRQLDAFRFGLQELFGQG